MKTQKQRKYKKQSKQSKKHRKQSKKHRKQSNKDKPTMKRIIMRKNFGGPLYGGALYKNDEIFTMNQLYNEPNFPTGENCIDLLIEKKSPILPTSISLSGKYTGEKYNKCKKSIQIFNTTKLNREDYLKYKQIIQRFNQRNQLYIQEQNKKGNKTILGSDKKIEELGSLFILQYIVDLFFQKPEKNTNELKMLLKIMNPYYYRYILDKNNYLNMKWIQCTTNCSYIKNRPEEINEMIQWIYNTNNELFRLKTQQDLINLLQNFTPMEDLINGPKMDDDNFIVTNVQINNDSIERYKSNNCWDVEFTIEFPRFLEYYYNRIKWDKQRYGELYTDAFERTYPSEVIYTGTNGKIENYNTKNVDLTKVSLKDTIKGFNTFVNILVNIGNQKGYQQTDETYINYLNNDDIQLPFEIIQNNLFIEKNIKILMLLSYGFVYPIFILRSNDNKYGIFYHYYDTDEYSENYFCNAGLEVLANTSIFRSDEIIDDIITSFFEKYIPNYDYNIISGKTQSNEYPRMRIVDYNNNMAIGVQCCTVKYSENKDIIGRCISITIIKNINSDIMEMEMEVKCLLIWEKLKDDKLQVIKDSCPVFYNGVLEPIFDSMVDEQSMAINSLNLLKNKPFYRENPNGTGSIQQMRYEDYLKEVDG